jgi:hypothetical protein
MDGKSFLDWQLAATQALVVEGERMIDNQVRLIAEMKVVNKSTADEDHNLDVMIKLHTAHLVYLKKLVEAIAQ